MGVSGRPIWFAGDEADPAARAIAAALPAARTRRVVAAPDLPRPWPAIGAEAPAVVVVHRATLGAIDHDRLARLRDRLGPARRIILCVGPHARYAEIERWAPLVDRVLPELTAASTIGRHVAATTEVVPASATGGGVAVISTNHELRAMLVATLQTAGLAPVERNRPEDLIGPAALPGIWDVPALEPDWPERLATLARRGPTIALIGFLDRASDRLAREAGASGCLDLPCDAADLVRAVDHAFGLRRDEAHPLPPRPRSQRSGR